MQALDQKAPIPNRAADTSRKMALHRVDRPDATMYLFEEHLHLADKLDLEDAKRERAKGSYRGVLFCSAPELEFVAKKERVHNDHYRLKIPKCGYRFLGTEKEVLLARALSEFGTYNGDFEVRYERPYGYIETENGRYGLFGKIDVIESTWSQYPPDIAKFLMNLDSVDQSKPEDCARVIDLKYALRQIYLPTHFGRVVLANNGIEHNEPPFKDLISFNPKTSKMVTSIIDFEFCKILTPSEIRDQLRLAYRSFDAIGILDMGDLVNDKMTWKLMEDAEGVIARANAYLGINSAQDIDNLNSFGPAQGVIASLGL